MNLLNNPWIVSSIKDLLKFEQEGLCTTFRPNDDKKVHFQELNDNQSIEGSISVKFAQVISAQSLKKSCNNENEIYGTVTISDNKNSIEAFVRGGVWVEIQRAYSEEITSFSSMCGSLIKIISFSLCSSRGKKRDLMMILDKFDFVGGFNSTTIGKPQPVSYKMIQFILTRDQEPFTFDDYPSVCVFELFNPIHEKHCEIVESEKYELNRIEFLEKDRNMDVESSKKIGKSKNNHHSNQQENEIENDKVSSSGSELLDFDELETQNPRSFIKERNLSLESVDTSSSSISEENEVVEKNISQNTQKDAEQIQSKVIGTSKKETDPKKNIHELLNNDFEVVDSVPIARNITYSNDNLDLEYDDIENTNNKDIATQERRNEKESHFKDTNEKEDTRAMEKTGNNQKKHRKTETVEPLENNPTRESEISQVISESPSENENMEEDEKILEMIEEEQSNNLNNSSTERGKEDESSSSHQEEHNLQMEEERKDSSQRIETNYRKLDEKFSKMIDEQDEVVDQETPLSLSFALSNEKDESLPPLGSINSNELRIKVQISPNSKKIHSSSAVESVELNQQIKNSLEEDNQLQNMDFSISSYNSDNITQTLSVEEEEDNHFHTNNTQENTNTTNKEITHIINHKEPSIKEKEQTEMDIEDNKEQDDLKKDLRNVKDATATQSEKDESQVVIEDSQAVTPKPSSFECSSSHSIVFESPIQESSLESLSSEKVSSNSSNLENTPEESKPGVDEENSLDLNEVLSEDEDSEEEEESTKVEEKDARGNIESKTSSEELKISLIGSPNSIDRSVKEQSLFDLLNSRKANEVFLTIQKENYGKNASSDTSTHIGDYDIKKQQNALKKSTQDKYINTNKEKGKLHPEVTNKKRKVPESSNTKNSSFSEITDKKEEPNHEPAQKKAKICSEQKLKRKLTEKDVIELLMKNKNQNKNDKVGKSNSKECLSNTKNHEKTSKVGNTNSKKYSTAKSNRKTNKTLNPFPHNSPKEDLPNKKHERSEKSPTRISSKVTKKRSSKKRKGAISKLNPKMNVSKWLKYCK